MSAGDQRGSCSYRNSFWLRCNTRTFASPSNRPLSFLLYRHPPSLSALDVDGYVDDGREIFDEADEAAEEEEEDGKASGKRKRNANIRKPGQPSAEQIAARNKQRQFMSQFLASKPEAGGKKAAKEVRDDRLEVPCGFLVFIEL